MTEMRIFLAVNAKEKDQKIEFQENKMKSCTCFRVTRIEFLFILQQYEVDYHLCSSHSPCQIYTLGIATYLGSTQSIPEAVARKANKGCRFVFPFSFSYRYATEASHPFHNVFI